MLSLHRSDQVHQRFVIVSDGADGFGILLRCVVVKRPRRRLRMQHERIHAVVTLAEQHTDTAHRIVERAVILPPRLLDIHRGRIVALAESSVGITLQMLAKQIDPADHLIFVDPFQLVVSHAVAATSEGFGKHLLFSELTRCRSDLIRCERGLVMSAQPVHARNVEIFVMRHTGAVGNELTKQILFQNDVSRQLQASFITEIVNLFHEVFGKQLRHELPEIHARLLIVTDRHKKLGESAEEIFAVRALVFLGQNEAPRNTVS